MLEESKDPGQVYFGPELDQTKDGINALNDVDDDVQIGVADEQEESKEHRCLAPLNPQTLVQRKSEQNSLHMPASMNCQDADEVAAGERIIDSAYKKLPYMQEQISFFMPVIDFTMATLITNLENKTLVRYDIFLSPWFLNGEDGLGKRRISHQCCEHSKIQSF